MAAGPLSSNAQNGRKVFLSQSASTGLTTSKVVLAIGAAGDAVPSQCHISSVMLHLDTISGASQVTWYLAADSDGDVALTPEQIDAILTGKTTATDGSVAALVDISWKYNGSLGTSGRLYLVAKLNSGTANGVARILGAY